MTRAFPAAGGASILAVVLIVSASGQAQEIRAPQPAKLTAILETDGARTGRAVRAALLVSLEEGLHTNSNKPRDPNLIPIELTIQPPAGVTVAGAPARVVATRDSTSLMPAAFASVESAKR